VPKRANSGRPVTRRRYWLTLLILMGVLVLVGLGQWDMVIAVVIGLVVGNALSWLVNRD